MFNIILDKLPYDYKGYLIRTDFRIGIQIGSCLCDNELNDNEKYMTAIRLLYGNGCPDIETAFNGIKWFMNFGENIEKANKKIVVEKPCMDFNIDSSRIYSGFKKIFDIDLKTTNMHWFEFGFLLRELRDCAHTDVIKIRTQDTKELSAKERMRINALKKEYSINDNYNNEQHELLKEFFSSKR